jgi:hypothetical protein
MAVLKIHFCTNGELMVVKALLYVGDINLNYFPIFGQLNQGPFPIAGGFGVGFGYLVLGNTGIVIVNVFTCVILTSSLS